MDALLVELLRFGGDAGILRQEDRYLVVRGHEPVHMIASPIDQADFLDALESLRYHMAGEEVAREKRQEALRLVADTASHFIETQKGPAGSDMQWDLVTSAAELACVPFEAARGRDGAPLFVRRSPRLVLTRRMRQVAGSRLRTKATASRPRVLFAWASPSSAGPTVPHEAHKDAIEKALRPWIEPLEGFPGAVPDRRSVLSVIDQVSLEKLEACCRRAAKSAEGPFTHIHLLAHGDVVGKGHRARFGLALHAASGRSQVVTGEQLAAALGAASQAGPEIVTIAACDGANLSNTLVPGSSVAYALHAVGVPIVLASHLPLTFEGSLGLPTLFLAQVFCGADVREALHDLRVHLYEHPDTCGHDWLSLVAYVRLPEQYEARLRQRGLSAMLGALDTAQVWSDHLDTHGVTDPEPFERVGRILKARIDDLIRFLKQGGDHVIKDENLGLLGSAEKRLAALWFRRWQLTQVADGLKQSHEALQRAHTWYFAAYRNNLSHHWSGVQHLALEAVLQGEIKDRRYWDAAYLAAETEAQQAKEIWAFGTLAELHLLSPCVGVARNLQAAETALTNLQQRIRSFGADPFPIASTRRQLRRYVDWWRTPYGFFGGRVDLAEDAARLLRVLENG